MLNTEDQEKSGKSNWGDEGRVWVAGVRKELPSYHVHIWAVHVYHVFLWEKNRFRRSVSFEHSPKGGASQELLRRKTEQWQGEKRCSDKENNVTVTRMRTSLERMMVLIFGFSLGFLLHPMLPLSPKVFAIMQSFTGLFVSYHILVRCQITVVVSWQIC